KGVRVQVLGTLLRGIYNLPASSPDPAKEVTGLGQTELDQLYRAITDDVADAFRRHDVPLLERSEQFPDVTPRLEVNISWSRIRADTVAINVTTRLMEAARLIKDPSKIVWGRSWEEGLSGYPASPESLAKEIRHVAVSGVNHFVELYARAHAR